jgi:hypothetical protein
MAEGRASWRSRCLGIVLGLAGAAGVLALAGRAGTPGPQGGFLVSDCDGPLRELVIHYTLQAAPVTGPIFKQFLTQLPAGVTVHVVSPGRAAYDDLAARVGTLRCRLAPVVVGHEITGWSRDRWLALDALTPGGPLLVASPRGERASDVWPARRGDEAVARDLALCLGRGTIWLHSGLFFDGGDFVADRLTAFVAPGVLDRNLHQTVDSSDELARQLRPLVGRDIVLLKDGPNHHAGMFMMTAGRRTVVVSDPAAGRRFWDALDDTRRSACFPQTPDVSDATRDRFDSVARASVAAGYRVVRIPTVPGVDSRTYLTYVNVIIDAGAGRPVVYMPVYRGVDEMNRAAQEVWSGLGYEVRPIDCTAAMPYGGSLRCLVSVLKRG